MRKVAGVWLVPVVLAAVLVVPFALMALNIGGSDLVKVGTGTRKLAMMQVYDATLYVPQDLVAAGEKDILAADRPMSVVIKIESRMVSTDLFVSSVEKGFKNSASVGYPTDKTGQFLSLFNGVVIKKGAVFQQNYDPKKGLTVVYTSPEGSSKVLGTVPGLSLKKAFLATFIGPKPNTADLKKGMLGKD